MSGVIPLGTQSNPYGASKVAVEAFMATFHELYDMDAMVLRYFNPYGPGEMHEPETHAVPNFIRAALEGRKIPLYWKGEKVRDFIYIDDLARAHTAVLAGKGLEYFNVGSETGTKIIDLVNEILDITGPQVEIEDLGERTGDVHASYASSEKLLRETSWRPQVSLREGLERTVEWERRRRS